MSMVERPTLEQVANRLSQLSSVELKSLIEKRIQNQCTDILPGLAGWMSPEDPADILIDSHEVYPDKTVGLIPASVSIVNEWKNRTDEQIQKDPEATAELLYLCARLRAKDAIPAISELAGRDSLARVGLSSGEDVQSFALRALGGLMEAVDDEGRGQYRSLFERALDVGRPIGLTALVTFWPDERESFVERAKQHPSTERLIEYLDVLVGTFPKK